MTKLVELNCDSGFIEFKILRSALDIDPELTRIHISIIKETVSQITLAGVPDNSFTNNSFNPDYSKYYEFNLNSDQLPSEYTPQP